LLLVCKMPPAPQGMYRVQCRHQPFTTPMRASPAVQMRVRSSAHTSACVRANLVMVAREDMAGCAERWSGASARQNNAQVERNRRRASLAPCPQQGVAGPPLKRTQFASSRCSTECRQAIQCRPASPVRRSAESLNGGAAYARQNGRRGLGTLFVTERE